MRSAAKPHLGRRFPPCPVRLRAVNWTPKRGKLEAVKCSQTLHFQDVISNRSLRAESRFQALPFGVACPPKNFPFPPLFPRQPCAMTLIPERTYTGDNIKILEGLEAVRLRPAMYIGSTGDQGLHHLVYEVVDNSVDEALAGYATHVDVTIHIDNSITVTDDGRGIPVDEMDVPGGERMPALQVVLTKLHAGGKFDSSNYKVSGGLHGVGVSCVNALSEELDVEVWKDLHTYEQEYAKGAPITKLKQTGTTKKRGTKIHFLPDRSIFTVTEYNFDTLAQRLRELAFLNKGLEIKPGRRADDRSQDRRGQAFRLQVCRRHRRVHQASESRQAGTA